MRPHILGGIVLDYAINEHLMIAGQINFIQKGIFGVNELLELEWRVDDIHQQLLRGSDLCTVEDRRISPSDGLLNADHHWRSWHRPGLIA